MMTLRTSIHAISVRQNSTPGAEGNQKQQGPHLSTRRLAVYPESIAFPTLLGFPWRLDLGEDLSEKYIAENHLTSNYWENTEDFLARKLEKDSLYPL